MGYTDSVVSTVTLELAGVWLHDPLDPEGSVQTYPYGAASRSSTVDVQGSVAWYAGRSSPVADYGDGTGRAFKIDVDVPHGPSWHEDLLTIRALAEAKRTLVLRDNRGRIAYGQIMDYTEVDRDWGTAVSFGFTESSYAQTLVA